MGARTIAASIASVLAVLTLLGATPQGRAQAPTLKTINVDGDLSDWDEILTNPVQVTLDGDGSSIPCGFSPDRDCEVQSTGRDLRLFAWTHDADHVYFYLRRQGSASNEQVFWFYMDVTGPAGVPDELMGPDDVVLRVRFNGSTGVTANALFPYDPASPGGDPMTDAMGRADGFDVPSDLIDAPIWLEGVPNGGSAAGDAFEERVPWNVLGVPPGTGLNFHVGSSNSPNPTNLAAQVDDNLGGPTGEIGTFAFDLVEIVPDNSGTAAPGAVASYGHLVRNLGSRPGTFALDAASSLGFSVSLFSDPDGDGVPDAPIATDANGDGDFADPGDVIEPGWDADGDGFPEVGPIPIAGEVALVVAIQTTVGADGQTDVTTVTTHHPARADTVRDAARDTTQVGAVVIRIDDPERNTVAGQNVNYGVEVCNNGADDVIDLTALSAMGFQVNLFSDPECDGVPNDFLAQDRRGNGSWDAVLGGDTDGDGDPDTGLLATGSCACFVLQISVPNREPVGSVEVTTVQGRGNAVPTFAEADMTTTVTERLELFPDYLFATMTERVSGPGRSVYFGHRARNNWLVADRVDFTAVPPVNDQGWSVRYWSDPNGDGNIFDGALIDRTEPIAPNGGETPFILEVRVPPGIGSGTTSTTTGTGAADLDTSVVDDVVDELEVSAIASYGDPLFTQPRTRFAPCETIHVLGTGLERRNGMFEDRYDLVYFDAADNNVRFHDPFVPDLFGEAMDQYTHQAADVPGTWRIELRDRSLTIATLNVVIEAEGSFETLTSLAPLYPLTGSTLSVDVLVRNRNVLAPFSGTTLEYVVVDPTGAQYLVSGAMSTFAAYTGVELTRTAAVPDLFPNFTHADPWSAPNVTYPSDGVYQIRATWRASCGTVLGAATASFVVGGSEDCANGVDDDGDTLADCDDPECAMDPACIELDCSDGIDNDGDGPVDCEDPDCAEDPACLPEEPCDDGVDNDMDGLADCEDPDCVADPACPETDCADGVDNDMDGLTDCDDLDCASDPGCQPENDCQDGVDNDMDGLTDCADPDCAGSPFCMEDCDDGADNDGDGLTDCDDPDCVDDPACRETDCSNGLDDDGDGDIDCDDSDCAGVPPCVGEDCANGVDDDGDGDVDCEDADCVADPAADCDGDGEPNGTDCDPADPTAFAVPGVVEDLRVGRAGADARVTWTGLAPVAGTGTRHDVVKGVLADLWSDRDFSRASCLAMDDAAADVVDPAATPAPPVPGWWNGFYYLVRGENACGVGPYRDDSVPGPRSIPPALCQ